MGGKSGRARNAAARSKGKIQPRNTVARSPQQPRSKVSHRVPIVRALLREGEWSRTDTLAAIGLVVAAAAIVVPILISTSSSTSGPDLKVEEVEIALAKNIDASVQIPGETVPRSEKDTGSAIDITLRNSGDAPALIVNAVFSFVRAAELYSCPGGAGAGVSTAEYDVKVPIARPIDAGNPLVFHREMRFVVNANSIDRFRITVGPAQYSSTSWPWIYEFNLSLLEDNGQSLYLGPMSTLGFSPSSTGLESWDPLQGLTQTQLLATAQLACVTRDAAELSHAMETPGLHSPELQTMYRQAERLTTFR